MQQIAEKAMQDKGINEKTWQQIWRCHKLVQRFLRDKMDREMMKFNVVETAFLSIKTATGVNDADTFIHKFLNKEAVYGELLGKIADNEREIGNLKAQNEELHRERKTLK